MNHAPTNARNCVVCGSTDARGLCTKELSGGDSVVLCGTHALMLQRSELPVAGVPALIAMARERRVRDERRDVGGDALALALTMAFANRDRSGPNRRTGQ